MKNDIIQTQKLEMQKKDEEIRQLKQQLEAAEEVKESQHSNAYYPSIAHSRGHAEVRRNCVHFLYQISSLIAAGWV